MLVKREDLRALIDTIHHSGKTVVTTNGCFDILHVRHAEYQSSRLLQQTAALIFCMSDM